MLEGPLAASIPARIQEQGLASVRVHDLRRWGIGRHRSVDDYTYGGGAGMVLRPEPVAAALAELRRSDSRVVLLDAAGEVFRQAVAVVEAVIRLLPGARERQSTAEEAHAAGLLEYPQYTRPPSFEGRDVPAVLVSGDHAAVRRWRLRESLRRTLERRPDLLEGRD